MILWEKTPCRLEIINTVPYHGGVSIASPLDTQIIETLEKLKTVDTTKRELTTVQMDILDSIPGADFMTDKNAT